MKATNIRLPFASAATSVNAGTASLLLLYVAIYMKDWASSWMSSSQAGGLLAAGLVLGFGSLALRGRLPAHGAGRHSMLLLATWLVVWILTLAAKGNVNLSSYYVAIPCAIVVVNTQPRLFIKLLLIHLALTLVIEAWEYFSGQYLFVYEAADGTMLDESLFGGSLDVFRAKGMFQGPLSAVAFALWMAFLLRGSLVAAAVLFLCAFFASGRLGMLTSLVLMLMRVHVHELRGRRPFVALLRRLPLLLGLAAVVWLLFASSDENRLTFFSSALDLGNDQNMSRIYFWLSSLNYYLNYSPIDLLVGNYGFILQKEGGTENDFLRLLLDCGLLGFLIYVGALVALLVNALRRGEREDMLIVILIIVLMNIFPFIQSLFSATLFWVYFFATMNRPRATVVPHRPFRIAKGPAT